MLLRVLLFWTVEGLSGCTAAAQKKALTMDEPPEHRRQTSGSSRCREVTILSPVGPLTMPHRWPAQPSGHEGKGARGRGRGAAGE